MRQKITRAILSFVSEENIVKIKDIWLGTHQVYNDVSKLLGWMI
jgi:hypothetical protein